MLTVHYAAGRAGHRERLRERFHLASAESMLPYEVLELLLTFSITRRDVKPVAKQLIDRFGSVAGVLDASREELLSVPDVGPASATLLKLVRQIATLYHRDHAKGRDLIRDPERVASYAAAKIGGLPHEAFLVLFLNVQNELLDAAVINEGTIDQVAVYPRRIIEMALARHAAGLILAHNHPSGRIAPSEEDKRLTAALSQAARSLDLRVLDHVIVGGGATYSFAAHGLL